MPTDNAAEDDEDDTNDIEDYCDMLQNDIDLTKL